MNTKIRAVLQSVAVLDLYFKWLCTVHLIRMQLSIGMLRFRLAINLLWFIFLDVLANLSYRKALLLPGLAVLLVLGLNYKIVFYFSDYFISSAPTPIIETAQGNTIATDWELINEYESLTHIHAQTPDHLQVLLNLISISHVLGYTDSEGQYLEELHQNYPTYSMHITHP